MRDHDEIANSSQTLENAFERTLAAVRARSDGEVAAQRRFIIWELLPRVIYHYDDPQADDAITVALRAIRRRIDSSHEIASKSEFPVRARSVGERG